MQHLRIGITGGMGAGKSTVCKIFNQIGIPIYDADSRAKWLMNNDSELKEVVRTNFGWDSYTRKDDLNREYLAKVVFNNEEKLKALNGIVHPAIMKDFEFWIKEHKNEPYSLKEAALLFESNSYKILHKVIVINSPIETRIERVVKRDHVKKEDVLKRIENQSSDRERMEKADWIIYNDSNHSLIEQVMKIHQEILGIRDQITIPFKS
jgi:dephospho-CoA kinase|tara:strand:+ start:1436 stop:2059 length:624 start_codon:yes stop_codon:yes gene_type:complete